MSVQFPIECNALKDAVDTLKSEIQDLQDRLAEATGAQKQAIFLQINAKNTLLIKAQKDLSACVTTNSGPAFPPAPEPTKPGISGDLSPVTRTKVISLDFMQRKFDEFFNKRTQPPILKVRLHHHDSDDNDPPASDATIFFIDAIQGYKSIFFSDQGKLSDDYYFNDINSSIINVNLNTAQPAPVEVKITFETGGDTDMPCTTHLLPDMNFLEFSVTIKLTLGFDPDQACIDLLGWVRDFRKLKLTPIPFSNPASVNVSGTFLGSAVNQSLPAFGFEDFFVQQVVNVHIVTEHTLDPGGATQKSMRKKVFEALLADSDPANNKKSPRDSLNRQVNYWMLGEDGNYPISNFQNDGSKLTMTYTVPRNRIDPFPGIPPNWPSANHPSTNPALDFSPGTLSNIDHIVVLTMENRSFDQMLGYLSLPVAKGGMGRPDVDGLRGGEFNAYNGKTYPSFPFAPGNTVFEPDPEHDTGPVSHQIDGGKMDGFVRSYAEEANNGAGTGDGSTIMGYHTGVNLPVYDALARDFAICHRWFAAHPGPTFCNRFYELTGRLNITSALDPTDPSGFNPDKAGFWEFNNSNPLTPVFTKNIFDFLTEYLHIVDNLTWNYYEQGYCFLRFFENYTFDTSHIVSINDPVRGFFANAARGTLANVSYIDPHFIELPPNGNCDGPPADVAAGQVLVQQIVEAVVASPKWNKTLLLILYDEHGGFYDHVPPPAAVRPRPDLPISTYGVRVPAFIISPWTKPGQLVFGHDASAGVDSLYFDSTSILKTIAKRFMSDFPPYMGDRYAAARDLSSVLGDTLRQNQFLPFIRYFLTYDASQKVLAVPGVQPGPGAILVQSDKDNTDAQRFSFEDAGNGFVYIRTHCGNLYVTVDIPSEVITTGGPASTAQGLSIKQDLKYKLGHTVVTTVSKFNPDLQKWKLAPAGITALQRNQFIISNAFFADKVLQPANVAQSGSLVVLEDRAVSHGIGHNANAWTVSTPLISDDLVAHT